jgi:hypothetical protein
MTGLPVFELENIFDKPKAKNKQHHFLLYLVTRLLIGVQFTGLNSGFCICISLSNIERVARTASRRRVRGGVLLKANLRFDPDCRTQALHQKTENPKNPAP